MVTNLRWDGDDEGGFFSAGKFIVENSDLLFAVWDGHRSKGLGGTADVVGYARQISSKIIHLNPITRLVIEPTGEENG